MRLSLCGNLVAFRKNLLLDDDEDDVWAALVEERRIAFISLPLSAKSIALAQVRFRTVLISLKFLKH